MKNKELLKPNVQKFINHQLMDLVLYLAYKENTSKYYVVPLPKDLIVSSIGTDPVTAVTVGDYTSAIDGILTDNMIKYWDYSLTNWHSDCEDDVTMLHITSANNIRSIVTVGEIRAILSEHNDEK